jgi:hypothetical protein
MPSDGKSASRYTIEHQITSASDHDSDATVDEQRNGQVFYVCIMPGGHLRSHLQPIRHIDHQSRVPSIPTRKTQHDYFLPFLLFVVSGSVKDVFGVSLSCLALLD